MNPIPALPALALALGLSLSCAAPVFAAETGREAESEAPVASKPAGGGKSSRQHAQAKAAKIAADKTVEEKAEAKAAKIRAGETPVEDTEKKKTWTHRAVRHKQTMPAAPSSSDAQAN